MNVRAVGVGEGGSSVCCPAWKREGVEGDDLGGVEGTTDKLVARRGWPELGGRDGDAPVGTSGLDRLGIEFIFVGLRPPTRPVGEADDGKEDSVEGGEGDEGEGEPGELAPNGELTLRDGDSPLNGDGGDTNCRGSEGRREPEGRLVGVPYMTAVVVGVQPRRARSDGEAEESGPRRVPEGQPTSGAQARLPIFTDRQSHDNTHGKYEKQEHEACIARIQCQKHRDSTGSGSRRPTAALSTRIHSRVRHIALGWTSLRRVTPLLISEQTEEGGCLSATLVRLPIARAAGGSKTETYPPWPATGGSNPEPCLISHPQIPQRYTF